MNLDINLVNVTLQKIFYPITLINKISPLGWILIIIYVLGLQRNQDSPFKEMIFWPYYLASRLLGTIKEKIKGKV